MSFFLGLFILTFCMAGCVFFAGMETGVISVNRLRLRHLVRHNVRGAKIVEMFLLKPDLLLGTTLVGNNLCAISSSIVAASMGYRLGGAAGTTIAAILFTVVLLIVGEYLPKAWFQAFPARRTLPLAPLLLAVSRVLYPLSTAFIAVSKVVVPTPAQEKGKPQPFVTREELVHLAEEGERSGVLTLDERRMINNVMELKTTTCGEIMVPRANITSVFADQPASEVLDLARAKEFNRFPVFDRGTGKIAGIIYIFSILSDPDHETKKASDYMRLPQLVSIETPVDHVLPRMRVTRQPMVLVADGKTEVVGLVTLEDVLDEVVGRI